MCIYPFNSLALILFTLFFYQIVFILITSTAGLFRFLTGVIQRERLPAFERLLWRGFYTSFFTPHFIFYLINFSMPWKCIFKAV